MFVDGLNADTSEPVKWKWTDGKEWVLCNLANQQGLFRTLDGLSGLTGDPRYKNAALEALRYAFDHLRYGTQYNGGLLAWGGHLAYNATDDVLAGDPAGDWFSVSVCTPGDYGIEKGLIFSYPMRSDGQKWEIVQKVPLNDFSKAKIAATETELKEEKSMVAELLGK